MEGRMKKVLSVLNLTFMSFGMVLLLSSFLFSKAIALEFVYQLLFCMFLISVLMELTNQLERKFQIDSLFLLAVLKLFDICIVVFPLGMGAFQFLPFTVGNVICVLAIILVVYTIGFFILLIDDMNTARRINEKIHRFHEHCEKKHISY